MAKVGFWLSMTLLLVMGCAKSPEQITLPVVGKNTNFREDRVKGMAIIYAQFPDMKPNLRDAFESLPRMIFVSDIARHRAYDDKMLPIGSHQTTLKLSDIAFVLSVIDIQPTDRVLEIGTGTGYLTALLSRLADQVFSVEINEYLSEIARQNINRLNIDNVKFLSADGILGWPRNAPYDVIIVTASLNAIPDAYLLQLKDGGRLAIPLNDPQGHTMWRIYHLVDTALQEVASRPSQIPEIITNSLN
ncbi:MAG: methyltransferase domain-containing protein [Proteobacteria bacterium]|nr:methyltransferase domain-containing protein [Pseudomonadota bacterium]